jgi:hypothetical protein
MRVPLVVAGLLLCACGQAPPRPAVPPAAQPPSADSGPVAQAQLPEARDAGAPPVEAGVQTPCPEAMILVDTMYCPKIERTCVDEEYSPQNRITICHRFAKQQRCLVSEERRRFCIDEYEYPNKKGSHPPWMVSWYDAQASCAVHGKRLCQESEWVAACEGPDKTPFPYGRVRDDTKCNVDNVWIEPSLKEVYSEDPEIRNKELSRLDQSVASGAMAGCVSGFGVRDTTGNFDEWVTADVTHKDKSEWAALKGGAWGHVRNACRPVTTSHPPDFTYYFIAFRCCKDAAGDPSYRPSGNPDVPEVDPADRAPVPVPVDPPGPSQKKIDRETWARPPRRP